MQQEEQRVAGEIEESLPEPRKWMPRKFAVHGAENSWGRDSERVASARARRLKKIGEAMERLKSAKRVDRVGAS